MDLAEWYAAGRWEALLDLIDQLPTASRLNEAIVNDPDRARELALQPLSTDPWSPRVSEFNLMATMLRHVIGELAGIQAAVIASAGGTPHQHKPFPSPITEVDRARAKLDREFAEGILRLVGFTPDDL